jgi:hypothetical protein
LNGKQLVIFLQSPTAVGKLTYLCLMAVKHITARKQRDATGGATLDTGSIFVLALRAITEFWVKFHDS